MSDIKLPKTKNQNTSEIVDPGDNTKFLSHALAVRNMPPIDTSDPVQVQQRISDYFTLCVQNDVKPSVKGFLNALRVAKSTLWEWKQGNFRAGTHQQIICEAYDVLEALWEDYMMNGKINPVSGIFLGKNNFGYQDKQEYVLTPNQQQITPEDVKLIESKYEELPGE
ncbi:terminase small subunit [Succinimonas sp.]|uniref:terminase small subunit n=1 Tax=Succinimonas sp. TaxID=1936151 RepID=UPI003865B6C4